MVDKKDMLPYLDDINKYIEDIKSSGLDFIDEKKYSQYIKMLNYYKQRWIDEVLPVETGPDLVSKAQIIYPTENLVFEFKNFMKNSGLQTIREKNSNDIILMLESLLNKDNSSNDTYENSLKSMINLYEHVSSNLSNYNISIAVISKYIYEIVKRKVLSSDKAPSGLSVLALDTVKHEIIKDAKSIIKENYDLIEKKNIQNDIKIILTVNDFSAANEYMKLFDKIISLNRTCPKKTIETVDYSKEEIKIKDLDSFYDEILMDLNDIKHGNYGLYNYLQIYIYYANMQAIDVQDFAKNLVEAKKDINSYKIEKKFNNWKLNNWISNKSELIAKINDSEEIIDESIFSDCIFKSNFDSFVFSKYVAFENYKKIMLNDQRPITLSDYNDYKETGIMFTNFLLGGYLEDSINTQFDKKLIFKTLNELINCDEDLILSWKINSYIRMLFSKNQKHLDILSDSKTELPNIINKTTFPYTANTEIFNKFYSNMIILKPILSKDEFENQFEKQIIDVFNFIKTSGNEIGTFFSQEYTIDKYLEEIAKKRHTIPNEFHLRPDHALKPFFNDFEYIYSAYESRKNPLKQSVKTKKLNPKIPNSSDNKRSQVIYYK